jgi:hypothetical protein
MARVVMLLAAAAALTLPAVPARALTMPTQAAAAGSVSFRWQVAG